MRRLLLVTNRLAYPILVFLSIIIASNVLFGYVTTRAWVSMLVVIAIWGIGFYSYVYSSSLKMFIYAYKRYFFPLLTDMFLVTISYVMIGYVEERVWTSILILPTVSWVVFYIDDRLSERRKREKPAKERPVKPL